MKKNNKLVHKYTSQGNCKKLEIENANLKKALRVANTKKNWAIKKLKKLVKVMLEL